MRRFTLGLINFIHGSVQVLNVESASYVYLWKRLSANFEMHKKQASTAHGSRGTMWSLALLLVRYSAPNLF